MNIKRGKNNYYAFVSAVEYQLSELKDALPIITRYIESFSQDVTVARVRFSGNHVIEIRRSRLTGWFLTQDRYTRAAQNRV
jgi:hypothetical protein